MKLSEMKDGHRYRITRPVINPKLDKRERYDTNLLPWSVGDVFRFYWNIPHRDYKDPDYKPKPEFDLRPIWIQGTPRRAIASIDHNHIGMGELLTALEERPERAEDVIAEAGINPDDGADVLDRLISSGTLTMNQIRDAVQGCRADRDAQDQAEQDAQDQAEQDAENNRRTTNTEG